MRVVRVAGVGAEGASGLGGHRRHRLESSCESPSAGPVACARDLHSPQSRRGSQEPLKPRHVQRLTQMT